LVVLLISLVMLVIIFVVSIVIVVMGGLVINFFRALVVLVEAGVGVCGCVLACGRVGWWWWRWRWWRWVSSCGVQV